MKAVNIYQLIYYITKEEILIIENLGQHLKVIVEQ